MPAPQNHSDGSPTDSITSARAWVRCARAGRLHGCSHRAGLDFAAAAAPARLDGGARRHELRQSSESSRSCCRHATLQEAHQALQEEIAVGIQRRQTAALFVLTIVTGAGAADQHQSRACSGMNVGGVPLSQHAHGFWIRPSASCSRSPSSPLAAFPKQRKV